MAAVTVYVTEASESDQVVVLAPAKATATNALVIALREQFGDRLRIVHSHGRDQAIAAPRAN